MNAIAAKKIEKSALIRRWSYELETLKIEISHYEDRESEWDVFSEIRTKLIEKIGRLEAKIAIKKAKIVYGRDNYFDHVEEFY